MADWVVWLVLAGGLAVVELFSLTFVMGLFAVAAALTGVAAVLGAPLVVQLGAFAASSGALWWMVKPLERAHRRQPSLTTGTAALVGRYGTVTEEVSAHTGRVTLGGETWAARSLAPGTIAVGASVSVAQVDGATLVVLPEEI